ncbi:hypothetical protein B6N60_02897 [Richelia sinica FACHB-800]|uniref:Uncharacterized protein n=1 Tax=Richelia sinica FACHB-800 TaxID=1357546 RepID=A0A975Y5G4_9NOST|nr:hypothetical protein B6N60_02897 [Richelia sinica FACHB-800]
MTGDREQVTGNRKKAGDTDRGYEQGTQNQSPISKLLWL